MHIVKDRHSGEQSEQSATVEVDGQRYRPGQLISVEDIPFRSSFGWTA